MSGTFASVAPYERRSRRRRQQPQVALRDLGIFGRDLHPRRQVGDRLPRRVLRHRHHDAHRLGGGLRVLQLAERLDLARGFLDPVAARDAEVEEPLGHIGRDLLGTENPHRCDGVINRSLVGDRRRPLDRRSAASKSSMVAFSSEPLGRTRFSTAGPWVQGRTPTRLPADGHQTPGLNSIRRSAPTRSTETISPRSTAVIEVHRR